MWTIEEIKCKFEDKDGSLEMFDNVIDEVGRYLYSYDDNDEFYTDGDRFFPKEYAESLYEHRLGIAYIEDRDLRPDLQEFFEEEVFTDLWLGFDYPQSKFKEAVKEFVFEDYDDFMEFYMEENYDKDTGNDSALD